VIIHHEYIDYLEENLKNVEESQLESPLVEHLNIMVLPHEIKIAISKEKKCEVTDVY
jgi:hypothetical protein